MILYRYMSLSMMKTCKKLHLDRKKYMTSNEIEHFSLQV